jgi:argininosuccinate lyase
MSRFREPADPVFQRLNSSTSFDGRLASHDVAQSKAHVRMLVGWGVVDEREATELLRGLEAVERELEKDGFQVTAADEDIHMAIERRLTELVGPLGGKLHTGRSRNDQVATDMAMFVRAQARRTRALVSDLMEVLLNLAEQHLDWPMPGYTHLQRAQPVYLSHHLLAYFWMFSRDLERFAFCLRSTGALPLGAGALAGVNWDTSRASIADELGFSSIAQNSLDAVSSRDFVLDFLGAAATCSMHLSRLGAEIVLWSSEEFRFVEIGDSFTSGSSIMPQKKNPDAAELLRAKAPRIAGHLVGLLGVMHALPLAYNKDMQEDKEHLFDAADTLEISLEAAAGMLRAATFNRDRLSSAAGDEFLAATEIADLLVRRGVPFREAHGAVAGIVRHALDHGKSLSELELDELRVFSDSLDGEYYEVLSSRSWLESKVSESGTASSRVRDQIESARALLKETKEAKKTSEAKEAADAQA